MDPALLKEREAFKRRALANPVVEKRAKKSDLESVGSSTKLVKKSKDDSTKSQKGNEFKFAIFLASYVKIRYLHIINNIYIYIHIYLFTSYQTYIKCAVERSHPVTTDIS